MSKSRSTGTAAETAVVRYLQNWWPAAERRALSGNKDKGDVTGIPGVVIEVKAAARQKLAAWRRETLEEQENALAHCSLLVVKRPYKPVAEWDAYLPSEQYEDDFFREVQGWVRMDLQFAAALLRRYLSSRS